MKRWIMLILAALLLAGCGDSDAQFSGQPVPSPTQVNAQLTGVWGAYFPGHQAATNDRGVEIQLGRQDRKGFLLRGNGPVPQQVEVTRDGESFRVVLTDTHNATDQSVITGTLLDATTLRGNFVNASRGESFAVDLKRHPDSDKFRIPALPAGGPGKSSAQDVGVTSKPVEVLRITANGDDSQAYSIDVWPGYPGYFQMTAPNRRAGSCYIQPLYWFASYSDFELREPGLIVDLYVGSLYVKIDDWTKVGYSPLPLPGSGDGSYIDSYPNGVHSGPLATHLKDFTFQVVSGPYVDGYNIYGDLYDPHNVFLYYSDRFPVVTRGVADYLDDYGY
jgi:hypothetical protein